MGSADDSGNDALSAINREWVRGRPSDDLTQAGLLVHALDGRGITVRQGFLREPAGRPPSGSSLWEMLGRADTMSRIGDRTSASIINKLSRAIYSPNNVQGLRRAGFSHLPFVVFDSHVAAVRSRVSCCYSFDVGSSKLVCPVRGGGGHGVDKCTPGCDSSNGTCTPPPF